MDLESYEKAQEIRSEISELHDLLAVFQNYAMGYRICLSSGEYTKNEATMSAEMRKELIEVVNAQIRSKEKEFSNL